MPKAVLTTRVDPIYDDLPEVRYHFPRTNLNTIRSALGYWIVYCEPRRTGGRQSYFATARLVSVEPDPSTKGHYYALSRITWNSTGRCPSRFGKDAEYYEILAVGFISMFEPRYGARNTEEGALPSRAIIPSDVYGETGMRRHENVGP